MELENKDILERNVSEKMCSSGSNGAGEICSPGTADTCGDSCSAHTRCCIKLTKNGANNTRYSCLQRHIFWQKYGQNARK